MKKQKTLLLLLLALVCAICFAFAITACGNGDTEQGDSTTNPDGENGEEPTDPDDDQDGVDEAELVPTEGLEYALWDDDAYACVGIGTATDKDIVIASEYNGLPVTAIASRYYMGDYNARYSPFIESN